MDFLPSNLIVSTLAIMSDTIYLNIAGCGADIHVIVKIESADSIPNLHSIITASDGVTI